MSLFWQSVLINEQSVLIFGLHPHLLFLWTENVHEMAWKLTKIYLEKVWNFLAPNGCEPMAYNIVKVSTFYYLAIAACITIRNMSLVIVIV